MKFVFLVLENEVDEYSFMNKYELYNHVYFKRKLSPSIHTHTHTRINIYECVYIKQNP